MVQREYNPEKLTVVVIDDHDPIRKGIKRILHQMRFGEIIECFDGADALKILAKKPVDLVICDLYMRAVSGFEVLSYIRNRKIGSDIPILVVTGEASKEEIVKAADIGADDYVLKPFQANDLERKIDQALTKYSSPPPLLKLLRRAERAFLARDFEKALTAFDEALKLDGDSMRATHGKALALEKLGRVDEALALLQDTVRRNHTFHRNFGAMADIYLRANQVSQAIQAMKKELEINPRQAERQIQLAKLLLKEGDAMGAIEHYREALKEAPNRKSALMGMGHAFAMAGNLDKSFYYFKRVRRYHPDHTAALEAVIRYAISAKEPKRAEMFLRDERLAHPDRTDSYILLAKFYLHQNEEEKGIGVLDELLARIPDSDQALRMKGLIYLRYKKFKEAAEELEKAAKVAPTAEIFAALGEALLGLDQIPQAMDALNKSVAMNHANPHAFLLLAGAYRKTHQFAKANLLYRMAAKQGGDKAKCLAEAKSAAQQVQARRLSGARIAS